jgi:hypothetical protein
METKQQVKEKLKNSGIDMVIVYHNRYFGLNFEERTIIEIDFKKAFGHDFFDWSNNIAIMKPFNEKKYQEARGKNGCGLNQYFSKRNDLWKMQQEEFREYDKKYKEKFASSEEKRE